MESIEWGGEHKIEETERRWHLTKVTKGIQTNENLANQMPALRGRSPRLEVIF